MRAAIKRQRMENDSEGDEDQMSVDEADTTQEDGEENGSKVSEDYCRSSRE